MSSGSDQITESKANSSKNARAMFRKYILNSQYVFNLFNLVSDTVHMYVPHHSLTLEKAWS